MSTLRCTNLQDTAGGNSLTTAQIYNGAAKAWVNFNGTSTVAIRAQFNVSSITDNGTGDYTVNFSTALADANYAVSAMTSSWDSAQSANTVVGFYTTNSVDPTTYTTTALRISMKRTQQTTLDDRPYISVTVIR